MGAVTSANTTSHLLSARVQSCSAFLKQAEVWWLVFSFNVFLNGINSAYSACGSRHATVPSFVALLLIVSLFLDSVGEAGTVPALFCLLLITWRLLDAFSEVGVPGL